MLHPFLIESRAAGVMDGLYLPVEMTEPVACPNPRRIIRLRNMVVYPGKASVGNGWCGVKPECDF